MGVTSGLSQEEEDAFSVLSLPCCCLYLQSDRNPGHGRALRWQGAEVPEMPHGAVILAVKNSLDGLFMNGKENPIVSKFQNSGVYLLRR